MAARGTAKRGRWSVGGQLRAIVVGVVVVFGAVGVVLREAQLTAGALLVTLLALTVVQCRIVRPLQRLTHAVADARDNRTGVVPPIDGPMEIVQLADQINDTISARISLRTR
jgi:hypothetical protein